MPTEGPPQQPKKPEPVKAGGEGSASQSGGEEGKKSGKAKATPTAPRGPKHSATREEGEANKKAPENTSEKTPEDLRSFNTENQRRADALSSEGKGVIAKVYENLHAIPGISPVLDRIQIVYSRFWIDRHEQNVARIETDIEKIDVELDAIRASQKALADSAALMQKQGVPGSASEQAAISRLKREADLLVRQKERHKSEREETHHRLHSFFILRDEAADRLIDMYDKRLKPIEAELRILEGGRREAGVDAAAREAQEKEKQAQVSNIEEQLSSIEVSLRAGGMREFQIKNHASVKPLRESLKKLRGELSAPAPRGMFPDALSNFTRERRIAKAMREINVYRDARDDCVRAKGVVVKPRKRFAAPGTGVGTKQRSVPKPKEKSPRTSRTVEGKTNIKEGPKTPRTVDEHINAWNKHIESERGAVSSIGTVSKEAIDKWLRDVDLSKIEKVPPKFVEDILNGYFKFKIEAGENRRLVLQKMHRFFGAR